MWIILVTFSVAVFILTGDPLLAALLPYLAAAEPSIQSAIWIRLRDPVAGRGKACLWFYLASAGWKAGATAVAHVFGFVLLSEVFGMGINMDLFAHTMIVLLIAVTFAAVLGWVGTIVAIRQQVRVFIVPRLFKLCGGDFGLVPVVALTRYRGWNSAVGVVAVSVFGTVAAIGTAVAIYGVSLEHQIPPIAFAKYLLPIGLGILSIGTFAAIPLFAYFSRRAVARVPRDCWGQ
jgi:hypothetical protein